MAQVRLPRPLRSRVLGRSFYDRNTVAVARDLLGKVLIHVRPSRPLAGRVVEVEAYLGLEDPASHIGRGFTPRTKGIFGQPGLAYVYSVYGMHHCANAITLGRKPYGAVLFRALEPVAREEAEALGLGPPNGRTQGPALLTRAMGIDMVLNGSDLTKGPMALLDLGFEGGRIGTARRVGITKAVEDPLRFYLEGNRHVSRPWPWVKKGEGDGACARR